MMAQAWTVAENMRPLSGSQPQSFHHEQGAHAAKTGTARVGRNGQAEKLHDASFFPSQWKRPSRSSASTPSSRTLLGNCGRLGSELEHWAVQPKSTMRPCLRHAREVLQ